MCMSPLFYWIVCYNMNRLAMVLHVTFRFGMPIALFVTATIRTNNIHLVILEVMCLLELCIAVLYTLPRHHQAILYLCFMSFSSSVIVFVMSIHGSKVIPLVLHMALIRYFFMYACAATYFIYWWFYQHGRQMIQ